MPFIIDDTEGLELDDFFQSMQPPDPNMYIADPGRAVELVATLIRDKADASTKIIRKITGYIDRLFALFTDTTLDDELELYEQFLDLCARLSERQKIRRIKDKSVIGFGGKFSAGKSRFINSIAGIGGVLPVAQAPTTSIPTYIIKAEQDGLRANSISGYSAMLTPAAMEALTHEFYTVYGIGFSAFIESIIVESEAFSLPEKIALLDTPGYTKFDDKSDSKLSLSDRQKAFEQLRAADYLFWLVDIENGGLTQDDITFMEALRVKTPILIVFTKADLKTQEDIQEILAGAHETVSHTGLNCFGITAYSAAEHIEYGEPVIPLFIDTVVQGGVHGHDIVKEFEQLEGSLRRRIEDTLQQAEQRSEALLAYITKSVKIVEIRSLVMLWGEAGQKVRQLQGLLESYDELVADMNVLIRNYIGKRG